MRQRRWFAGFLTWAVAVGALGLVCVTRSSRADDKSDLIRRIEDLLDDAGDALERLPGDSGDGPIGYADRYVQDARRAADDLARVAGDDASAKRLADDFDDVQDDWNEAAGYLRQLKAGARQHEPVAQRCVDAEKDLLERARAFESKNDPDGLAEIPRLASAAQDSTKRALDDLYRHDDRMEDLADDADDFRGDGPWRDLASTVAQVTRTMFEKWRRDYDQTKRTCENLARGVDHPAVKEILGKLGTSAGGRKAIIEQLNRDARELASTLAGVSEDSSTGSVARAKRLLENIDRGVQTLAGTPTTDKEARLIVEKWPEGIRQLGEALDDLEDLKVHQHDMDPLPEKCQLKERELRDAIARNADDADGIDELPRLADQLAEPVRAGLTKADERMREEASDLDRAKAISASDGPWSDIRAAEQRDADETFRTYEDGYKKTKDACADIAKGKDSPIAKAAVESLQKKSSGRGDLVKDLESKIDAAAQRLNGAASRTGDGDVTTAVTLGNEMTDALARLRNTPGNDRRVKEVLERWPAYVELYKAAVGTLVLLKRAQYEADGLAAECKRDDEALLDYIAQFKNPAGIAPIQARAVKDQAASEARLQTHRARRSQLDSWRGAATGFQLSDGKWSYLSGYVRSAAQGMFDYWVARQAEGEKACDGLLKGADHPKVAQALNMLRGRIPPAARHASEHDSTCVGVPASGFCTQDDQCLDRKCASNECTRCPYPDDGQCHPPGTCTQADYDARKHHKDEMCEKPLSSKPFNVGGKVDCSELEQRCINAAVCLNSRKDVADCFKGGDSRHRAEIETISKVLETCEALLKEKRARDLCQ